MHQWCVAHYGGASEKGNSMARTAFLRRPVVQAALVFLSVWAACTGYLAYSGGNFLFPISSLLLFGVILTGAAIFLTRKTNAPPVPVDSPKKESIVLLGYLLIYAFILFGPVAGLIRESIVSERTELLAMLAYKLLVHLVVPLLLLKAVHAHLNGIFDAGLKRRAVVLTALIFSTLMVVVVGLLNSIFDGLSASGHSVTSIIGWAAFAWLWVSIEAGLCEEFLFRAMLQSRLTAWFQSAPFAIVATSIIFALVHVPALYLRGGEAVSDQASSLPQIIALSVAAIGPISVLFGTLWYRTRSLLLVVLIHGATDALPAIEKMMRIWT
jgi:membrane protease YdiL (CAAX protease family)